jgi:hypothetical protein
MLAIVVPTHLLPFSVHHTEDLVELDRFAKNRRHTPPNSAIS